MPAGAVGSCWAADSWSATAWEANSWADAEALAFVLDLNTRILVYLRDFYSDADGDLSTLIKRYLESADSGTGDMTQRFKNLIQDATDAS
jgi:hypothetical protein